MFARYSRKLRLLLSWLSWNQAGLELCPLPPSARFKGVCMLPPPPSKTIVGGAFVLADPYCSTGWPPPPPPLLSATGIIFF